MRIALTHAYCWPEVRRGAERFVAELSAALGARGHDVVVFSGARMPRRTSSEGVSQVVLRQVRSDGVAHEADFGRRVVPYLVANRFDAVHSLGRRDAVGAIRAGRLCAHRTVFTDLGIPLRAFWESQVGETAPHERVVREVDVYGCMSRYALDALQREYGRRGVLTPGGVDLRTMRPADRRTDHPTILFSGAIYEPRKGVARLLEAVALLAADEPAVELWLSGPGDPTELLAAAPAAARERTRVLGLGDAGGQAPRYGRAWVTALPSQHDSFGMALVESLACGTPIVGSTHSAVPELVTPDNGALCDAEQPESIAAACRSAFELAGRAGTVDACRASAARFDWHTSLAPRFEEFYGG